MKYGKRAMIAVLLVGLGLLSLGSGCATPKADEEEEEKPGDLEDLEKEVRSFHSNMRWARFEEAADAVHEAYRYTFEGQFEERGEDYQITEMNLRRADVDDGGLSAVIEIEQEWFELPSTVVNKERFMERWVFEDGRWWMRERMLKDEYREQDSAFDSELQEKEAEERAEAEAEREALEQGESVEE